MNEYCKPGKDNFGGYSKKIYSKLKTKLGKQELLKGGMEDILKYWKNFNTEKFKNPGPYFKELFRIGIIKYYIRNTIEYKEKRFLDSLNSMGRKILRFNLPYEIELDGSIIRKFSFVDNPDAHDPSIKPNYEQNS